MSGNSEGLPVKPDGFFAERASRDAAERTPGTCAALGRYGPCERPVGHEGPHRGRDLWGGWYSWSKTWREIRELRTGGAEAKALEGAKWDNEYLLGRAEVAEEQLAEARRLLWEARCWLVGAACAYTGKRELAERIEAALGRGRE